MKTMMHKAKSNLFKYNFQKMSVVRHLASLPKDILDLAIGIQNGRRDCLARAITLIESTRHDHRENSSQLIEFLINDKKHCPTFQFGHTLRLGIAGPPGAGKSTFIEALGMRLIDQNLRIAVVPVDPSSHISGGSILGDKTRMEKLSKSENAYIRASPTKGVLGGIAEHTSEVIQLCEFGNYDVVIVESVGLGQSEVDIDMAVDMLIIVVPPGGGDSLQATKKGIMEAADLIVVNKADGTLLTQAKHTKSDYSGAMQFIRQKSLHWKPPVLMISSKTTSGLDQVEQKIRLFHNIMIESGELQSKRSKQNVQWMWNQLQRICISQCINSNAVKSNSAKIIRYVESNRLSSRFCAKQLFSLYIEDIKQNLK